MSNYYEALRKIMSDGKLKKAKIRDLIREAGETDTKPTKVRRVRTKKETSKEKRLNQFGGVMDDIDLDRELEIGRDVDLIYAALLPKEKVGKKPVKPVRRSDKWDPIAQEETDLLAKYAKEDSLERGRDKLRTQRDILNNYGDIAYKEGYNDPESRRILFNAMDELGSDYEDAIKMIKGDISGFTGNPRFANDPMIREAFENYLYEKKFPIDKIEQLNKATSGSIVSNEVLSDREKMLRLLEDIEAQTGIDKMFTTKLRDDASAVGGVIDETPVEIRGMSQMGRRQMSDDLKDRLVAYRTRKGAATGTEIDDVLLNPYLSSKDLSRSKRVSDYINEETRRLKREQNIRPGTDIKPLKDVHPGPKWKPMRDPLVKKDRSELLEEAINDRYGSVDNLRKINSDVPEGAEHIVDEANSWLNAYDDAIDAERKMIDFEDNRHAESIADLFEDPAVIDRRNPIPRSRDYGEETLSIRDKSNKTRAEELQFIAEAAERKGLKVSNKDKEQLLWLIRDKGSKSPNRKYYNPVKTLDEILDEIVRRRSNR